MAVLKYRKPNGEFVEVLAPLNVIGGTVVEPEEPVVPDVPVVPEVDNKILIKFISGELTEIEIPDGTTQITDYSFYRYTGLHTVVIPSSVTRIGNYAFSVCSDLANVNIPEGVKEIGQQSFSGCCFTHIELPSTLETLNSSRAFSGNVNLKTVVFKSTPQNELTKYLFENDTGITDIYVPWKRSTKANAPWGAVNATIHYEWTGE